MDTALLITAFATLFVVLDPLAIMPLFLALTRGADRAHRKAVAYRACATGGVILVIFGFFGEAVLGFIGISMSAFRIAGGLLLLLTALDMLFERRTQRRKNTVADLPDPSVFPLATPLIAGPGAIATVILLMGQTQTLVDQVIVIGVLLFILVIVCIFFLSASYIEHLIGQTGINVITRLLGMLLAALSIQFILDGIMLIDWSGMLG